MFSFFFKKHAHVFECRQGKIQFIQQHLPSQAEVSVSRSAYLAHSILLDLKVPSFGIESGKYLVFRIRFRVQKVSVKE